MEYFLLTAPTSGPTLSESITALLLAFVLSMTIAASYRWSHASLSYSRTFVQTQILGSLVTCMVIMAIGNNLARGLGILGTLAIIRFRTPIRDPRDIIFLFACLGVGIAAGAGVYSGAIIGTIGFVIATVFLHVSPFATQTQHEGLLRILLPASEGHIQPKLEEIITEYTVSSSMVAAREAVEGDAIELSYQVRLSDPSYQPDLLEALRALEVTQEVGLLMQRTTVEL